MFDPNVYPVLQAVVANPGMRHVIFVEQADTAETLIQLLKGESVFIVTRPSLTHHVSPVTALTALLDRHRPIEYVFVQLTTLQRGWTAPSGNYKIHATYDVTETEANLINRMFRTHISAAKQDRLQRPVQKPSLGQRVYVARMLSCAGPDELPDGYVYAYTESALNSFKAHLNDQRHGGSDSLAKIESTGTAYLTDEGFGIMQASVKKPAKDWLWTDRRLFNETRGISQ